MGVTCKVPAIQHTSGQRLPARVWSCVLSPSHPPSLASLTTSSTGSEATGEVDVVQPMLAVVVAVVEDIVPTTSLEVRTSWLAGDLAAPASPRARERPSAGPTG